MSKLFFVDWNKQTDLCATQRCCAFATHYLQIETGKRLFLCQKCKEKIEKK